MKLDEDLARLESSIDSTCGYNKCTRQVVYIVRIHLIDHCTTPGLDVNGNKVFTLCPTCALEIAERIAITQDISMTCKTCGRHIEKLHDFYDVESLVHT